MSVTAPGENATVISTGLDGKLWAQAESVAVASTSTNDLVVKFIVASLYTSSLFGRPSPHCAACDSGQRAKML